MDTLNNTSLAELWERQAYKPTSSIDNTREFLQDRSANKISSFDSSNADIYNNAIFKNLWNKKVLWKENEIVDFGDPQQQELFATESEDYMPDNTVVFRNGTFTSDSVQRYNRQIYFWKNGYKGSQTYKAYTSLFEYVESSMPGLLASQLSSSANVLNIDPPGKSCKLLLTSDAFFSNEASRDDFRHHNHDAILDSGIYIVRVRRGKSAYIKEVHHDERKLFCNQWIYIVDYGASLTLDRKVLSTAGVMDNVHIIQYPNSKLTINTYDHGTQWRNISITAYQDTKTIVNGSTLLKTSDSGNFVDVHHRGPNGDSDIKYKSAIYDKNTGNFIGQISVDKKAEGTKSFMTNKNLLVEPLARAVSRPILRINTKEIECSHGCTTSKIRDEDLYYLETLGMDKGSAKSLIASGHIQI